MRNKHKAGVVIYFLMSTFTSVPLMSIASCVRPIKLLFSADLFAIAQRPSGWRWNTLQGEGCFNRPSGSVSSVSTFGSTVKPVRHRHPRPISPTVVWLGYIVAPLLNLPDCRRFAAVDAAVRASPTPGTADSMRKSCSHSFWFLGLFGLY